MSCINFRIRVLLIFLHNYYKYVKVSSKLKIINVPFNMDMKPMSWNACSLKIMIHVTKDVQLFGSYLHCINKTQ